MLFIHFYFCEFFIWFQDILCTVNRLAIGNFNIFAVFRELHEREETYSLLCFRIERVVVLIAWHSEFNEVFFNIKYLLTSLLHLFNLLEGLIIFQSLMVKAVLRIVNFRSVHIVKPHRGKHAFIYYRPCSSQTKVSRSGGKPERKGVFQFLKA